MHYDKLIKESGLKKPPDPPFIQRADLEQYLKEVFARYCTSKNKKIHIYNNLLFCAKKPENDYYKNLQAKNINWYKRISSRYQGDLNTVYLKEL